MTRNIMNKDFKDGNKKTVEAYDFNWAQHQIQEADLPRSYFDSLDWLLAGLDKSARIFEIGSGAGYDALYFQSQGWQIDCSEAAPSGVKLLRQRGLAAEPLNAITDELPAGYRAILALGVVVHFGPEQLQLVCDKVFAALDDGGRFGLSTVDGQLEKWDRDGHGLTRYVSHLPEADLRAILTQSGFGPIKVEREAINEKVDGLSILAYR